MSEILTALRPRLRPIAAALALAIAAEPAFAAAHAARLDAPPPLVAARERERSASAPHGTVTVTSCDDSGPGTLREAYFNAVDGTEIDLSQLACSKISLTSGALTDPGGSISVSITGPGKYALTIDGGYSNRVLVHNGSGTLSISGVRIAHGSYSGTYGGGCIYSYGGVELGFAIVTGCQMSSTGTAKAYGGAIYSRGTVTVIGSEVSNGRAHAASANSAGGGIWADAVSIALSTVDLNVVSGDGSHYARGGGVFSLRDSQILYSTISNNGADSGAGAFFVGAASYTMQIANSTISGNHATGAGGGLYAKYRPLEIANSTIAENTSESFGAGLYLAYPTELESTIVAGNTTQGGLQASDISGPAGTAITGANNLVVASTLPLPGDTITLDPMLGPLQLNGGYTATHALLPGSPAIDRGNNVISARYDQRFLGSGTDYGYERQVGPAPDIGAFEFGAPDRLFTDGFDGPI